MSGPQGPFAGHRVLEIAAGDAGRTAGVLLADLGADVVRLASAEDLVGGWDARRVYLDRSKRRVVTGGSTSDPTEVERLLDRADVVVVDAPPTELGRRGLDADTVLEGRGHLVHVWLPPIAAHGPWSDLPHDDLLLQALGGFASHHPASDDRPVASVVPLVTRVHGALGALAAATALLGRARGVGAQRVSVTGLQASAAVMGTMLVDGLDVDRILSPGKSLRGAPNFRLYRTADGPWVFLAALSPELFFRALDVLGCMEVLARPDVGGEFANVLVPATGAQVGAILQAAFSRRTAAEWLSLFGRAGVPAAEVSDRRSWMDSPVLRANGGRIDVAHPELGSVSLPGVPVWLSATPGAVAHLPGPASVVAGRDVWPGPGRGPATGPPGPSWRPGLPLQGLRIVDLSTFLAAPFAAALLADHGADVVKVEPPAGDPYRAFPVSYVSVNQRKQVVTMDLRTDTGRSALLELLSGADVAIDNMRPASLERLGLGATTVETASPRLVRCSVSAFGHEGPWSDLPGFDPIMQVLSGLATAQGGRGDPVTTTAPVHDVATGTIAALGIVGALLVRERGGRPQRVATSLAAVSTLLQGPELTHFAGRPDPPEGGVDHPGPTPTRRFYRTQDGWLAVSATDADQVERLWAVVCGAAPRSDSPTEMTQHLAAGFATLSTATWVERLRDATVPVSTVLGRSHPLDDPALVANDFSHVVRDGVLGRLRVVRAYATWPGTGATATTNQPEEGPAR